MTGPQHDTDTRADTAAEQPGRSLSRARDGAPEGLREQLARALYDSDTAAHELSTNYTWPDECEPIVDSYRRLADAALVAFWDQQDQLRAFAEWVVSLDDDDPESPGRQDRRTVTLNAIVGRARAAVGAE